MKLEVGKRYVLSDGTITLPAEKNYDPDKVTFLMDGVVRHYYKDGGKHVYGTQPDVVKEFWEVRKEKGEAILLDRDGTEIGRRPVTYTYDNFTVSFD